METNEIHPSETGGEKNLPPENQTPPAPVPSGAPPPAANLVVLGDVKSERELEVERRESAAAERERKVRAIEAGLAGREKEIQTREEVLRTPPPPPVPKSAKVKRKPNWNDPVFAGGEEKA